MCDLVCSSGAAHTVTAGSQSEARIVQNQASEISGEEAHRCENLVIGSMEGADEVVSLLFGSVYFLGTLSGPPLSRTGGEIIEEGYPTENTEGAGTKYTEQEDLQSQLMQ